jgi:phage-related tail fiber protein
VRQGTEEKSVAKSLISTVVPDASTTVKGIVELATVAEAQAGTDTVRAVTPAGLSAVAPAGQIIFVAQTSAPPSYLKANGSAISRATYSALFAAIYKSATVTMTIAAPAVITWNGHSLNANDPVQFTSTGVLPTGFVTATNYYVVGASITTNTFQLSATPNGTAITTTGSQSGIHTAHNAPFGIGDGSTTFNVPDLRGEFVRGWDDARGVDAGRGLGTWQADDLRSHSHTIPGSTWDVSSGTSAMNASGGTSGFVANRPTAATGGTETRPRNVALLACIKF